MISSSTILTIYVAALFFAAQGQAPENTVLETLTALNRIREVCEEGGPKFQPDEGNCGRFYECGIVGLAYYYVSNMHRSHIRDKIIHVSISRNVLRTTSSTWNNSTATIRRGSIAGIGRDAKRRLGPIV